MRAQTRANLQKAKKRATKLAKITVSRGNKETESEYGNTITKVAQHTYRNRKNCSCAICRNPRTSRLYRGRAKLSLQELKQMPSKTPELS